MRVLLFETVTGDPVMDLQVSAWSYDTGILAPDRLDVTVPAYTPWAQSLDLRSLLARDKHSIALVDESVEGVKLAVAAGPIVSVVPGEDQDGNNGYAVSCRGIERLFEFRHVRLYPGWPLIGSNGKPTGTYDQAFEDVEYGTIMKGLVAESEKFTGGALPIVYEPDRVGVHERSSYAAVDGKPIIEALDQLADLSDGVEYDFQPQVDDLDNVSYKLVTGTDSGRIISRQGPVWNLGGERPDVRGYERTPDPAPLFTDSVFTGGKDDDRVLLAKGENHGPIADGFPRMEVWDQSHATVSKVATLQKWANGALTTAPDRLGMDVRADLGYGVRHGDMVKLAVEGHWDYPTGVHDLRVLSVARSSSDPDWVSVNLV